MAGILVNGLTHVCLFCRSRNTFVYAYYVVKYYMLDSNLNEIYKNVLQHKHDKMHKLFNHLLHKCKLSLTIIDSHYTCLNLY